MKNVIKIIVMAIIGICISQIVLSQTTYHWIGKTTGIPGASDWQSADNWDPQRTTPAATDILAFDDTYIGFHQYNINNIPNQTIGTLQFDNGAFFFESSTDTSKLLLTSLLYIDRYGSIDLKGWANLHPVQIELGASGTGTVSGSIIADKLILNDASLTTIGGNYAGLTRSARLINARSGALLTLSTSSSIATELIIEDTLQINSNAEKYASLLLTGSPEPQLLGDGLHLYHRRLLQSKYKDGPSGTISSGTSTSPSKGVRQKCCGPTKKKVIIDIDPDIPIQGVIWCGDNKSKYFPRQNDPTKTNANGHAEIDMPDPCPDPVKVIFTDPSPPPISPYVPLPYCDPDSKNSGSSCVTYAFEETTYTYVSDWNMYGLLDYQAIRGKYILVYQGKYFDSYQDVGIFHNGHFSTGIGQSEYQISGSFSGPGGVWCGWNLMGNPYPSSINWGTDSDPVDGWTRTNIYNSFYIWNMDLGQYAYFNGAGDGDSLNGGRRFIAPCQGFWIRADSNQTNYVMAMDNRVRLHSTVPYLKKTVNQTPNSLRVKAAGYGLGDELLVKFNPDAGPGIDAYDTYKFYGAKEAPQVFTMDESKHQLSINTMPVLPSFLDVPMGFTVDTTGSFTLTFTQVNSFGTDVKIMLEDTKTHQMITLQEGSTYEFKHVKGDSPNRFILHFYKNTFGVDESTEVKAIQVFSSNGNLYVKNFTGITGKIFVYDATGREVYASMIDGEPMNSFNLAVCKGYYIARVVTSERIYNQKVFIN